MFNSRLVRLIEVFLEDLDLGLGWWIIVLIEPGHPPLNLLFLRPIMVSLLLVPLLLYLHLI